MNTQKFKNKLIVAVAKRTLIFLVEQVRPSEFVLKWRSEMCAGARSCLSYYLTIVILI